MRRKHRTAADWQAVLAKFNASDLRPVAFCQTNQIGIKSFYRARIKYGSATGTVAGCSPSGFIKVTRADRSLSTGSSGIEVILPHARLRLDSSVCPDWVANLLKSLAA
jgi:hypothetical protein